MTYKYSKKVLILGGTRHMIDYVEAFKAAGIYTILVDEMAGSSVKKYADLSYSYRPEDVISLAKLVKDEGITGVFADMADITTWNAIAVCKKAGVPFYVPVGTGNPDLREHCRMFGVSIEEQGKAKSELIPVPAEIITWPDSQRTIVSLVG